MLIIGTRDGGANSLLFAGDSVYVCHCITGCCVFSRHLALGSLLPISATTILAMSYQDEEKTTTDHPPSQLAVRREDSAITAAGHIRLELVDDKIGNLFVDHQ